MFIYHYTGDHPIDIPAYALMNVQPGDTITVPEAIRHPDFQPV